MIDEYWIITMFMAMLWIQGIHCLFSDGHLFEKIGEYAKEVGPEWLYKPTIGCAMCMSSLHGTLWYFLQINREYYMWPVFCICLCGLNYVISKFTTKERIIVEE